LKDLRAESIEKIGKSISSKIRRDSLLGLGSGTTMATLLPIIAADLTERRVRPRWVPTSLQISLVAQGLGQETTSMDRPILDLVVDGADQIDADLNLIKGGGGALFREKVLIGSSKSTIIVADEKKLADRLCSGGVRIPVEAHPFARVSVAERLRTIGGEPRIRIDGRGFPFYTENGNLIFDTGFEPIEKPSVLEAEIKSIAGVVESGIFTPRPLEVYVIEEDGGFRVLRKN
jgi:ribose 5-phosphate isomerase A